MFSLENHVPVVMVLFYSAYVAWAIPAITRYLENRKKDRLKRRVAEMVSKLSSYRPLWVMNEKNGVTAVCTSEDFHSALSEWKTQIFENREVMFCLNPILYVENTYTFHKENWTPFMTGSSDEILQILTNLIYELLGREYDRGLIQNHIKVLGRVIVNEDPRLYVPFMGVKWDSRWESYWHTTVGDARHHLYEKVLSAIGR